MSEQRKVTIQVSDEDIRRGVKAKCTGCPVAQALRRSGFPDAYVEKKGFWTGPGAIVGDFVRVSARVTRRIRDFDRTGDMDPFSFRIRAEPTRKE